MKKNKIVSLLLGTGLMLSIGTSTLSASAKCGAGKCGGDMKEKKVSKCGGDMPAKKISKCGGDMPSKKASKCGRDKKEAPKASMKCGVGKCG